MSLFSKNTRPRLNQSTKPLDRKGNVLRLFYLSCELIVTNMAIAVGHREMLWRWFVLDSSYFSL